jgi:hypothetical protein
MSIRIASTLIALLVISMGQAFAADMTVSMQRGDPRVIGHERCGDDGNCISVALDAPGRILSVDYTCTGGGACGWIYPCPDVGVKCGVHRNRFEIIGKHAEFWAWTNSGNPNGTLTFVIHYE